MILIEKQKYFYHYDYKSDLLYMNTIWVGGGGVAVKFTKLYMYPIRVKQTTSNIH